MVVMGEQGRCLGMRKQLDETGKVDEAALAMGQDQEMGRWLKLPQDPHVPMQSLVPMGLYRCDMLLYMLLFATVIHLYVHAKLHNMFLYSPGKVFWKRSGLALQLSHVFHQTLIFQT